MSGSGSVSVVRSVCCLVVLSGPLSSSSLTLAAWPTSRHFSGRQTGEGSAGSIADPAQAP